MKTVKTLILAKSLAVAAVAASGLSAPMAAQASESAGVTCPADTTASLVSGVLKCKKQKVLASICSPLAFSSKGITINTNIVMQPTGSDTCLAVATGQIVASVMQPPTIGVDPPASAFVRRVNLTAPDTFVADQYVFPAGAIFIGDASRGVKCPSGYSAVAINNNTGMRCQQRQTVVAGCDSGWTVTRRSGVDVCTTRDWLGNTVTGQYTIPTGVGYIGLYGNPETHGWNLRQDFSASSDYWQSESVNYRYPVVV
jgi:hypothetical protein